jgi:hypothetical protein
LEPIRIKAGPRLVLLAELLAAAPPGVAEQVAAELAALVRCAGPSGAGRILCGPYVPARVGNRRPIPCGSGLVESRRSSGSVLDAEIEGLLIDYRGDAQP